MTGSNFDGVNLANARFFAVLSKAKFTDTNLNKAEFDDVNLADSRFNNVNLAGANIITRLFRCVDTKGSQMFFMNPSVKTQINICDNSIHVYHTLNCGAIGIQTAIWQRRLGTHLVRKNQ